jgi:hypothetical protein
VTQASAARRRDLASGIICLAAGLGVVQQAQGYGIGTLAAAGPGLYPLLLGLLLAATGIAIAATALTSPPHAEEREANDGLLDLCGPDWRGWSCIIAGVLAFILCASAAGLAPAIFACVFISALGDRTATLKGSLLLALGMAVFATLLFGKLLGINMPLWQMPFAP